MRRAMLIACLVLGGCADEGVDTTTGQQNVSGDWSYTWEIQALSTMHGTLTLEQAGIQVTGNIALPDDYNPLEVDPNVWDWRMSGTIKNPQINAGPGCACSPVVPFDLLCAASDRVIDCSFTRIDAYGTHPGTFKASR